MLAGLGTSGELLEEPRLADPGLAHQFEGARMAFVKLIQDLLERIELVGPPHERI